VSSGQARFLRVFAGHGARPPCLGVPLATLTSEYGRTCR
jgi:hypothetical protein